MSDQLDRLRQAAHFYQDKGLDDLFPYTLIMREKEWKILTSLRNIRNRHLFGLSEQDYEYIFLSNPQLISTRIKEYLNEN